jgi:hypothetical protein
MRALARCAMAAALGTFRGTPTWQTINASVLRGFLCRGTERPRPSFSRCTDMVARLERRFQSIALSMHFMLSRGRAKGRPLPQDRFAALDASLGTRKEHFCIDDLWLKPDGPDAR